MIKQALEYLIGLNEPSYKEYNGQIFTDANLHLLPKEPPVEKIVTSTLKSVVDYIVQNMDYGAIFGPKRYIIHIVDAKTVLLYDELNDDGHRQCRLQVYAMLPQLKLYNFIDLELMNIMLQSNFCASAERDMVLEVLGSISDGQVVDHQDDGVSQKVMVRAGIRRVGMENVPNPVKLAPYRTFLEVEQPSSLFILRLRSSQDMPAAGLFEADGGIWRLEACQNIRCYFEQHLAERYASGEVAILS